MVFHPALKQYFIVGDSGDTGIVMRLNEDGDYLGCQNYTWAGQRVFFRNIALCDDGHLMIFGGNVRENRRGRHVLVKLNPKNNLVIIAKAIHDTRTRSSIRLISNPEGSRFYFVGWNNLGDDQAEIGMLTSQLKFQEHKRINISDDIQIYNAEWMPGVGPVILGSRSGNGGVLCCFDPDLNLQNQFVINPGTNQHFKGITSLGTNQLVLSGVDANTNDNLLIAINRKELLGKKSFSKKGSVFRNSGTFKGTKNLVRSGEHLFYYSYSEAEGASELLRFDLRMTGKEEYEFVPRPSRSRKISLENRENHIIQAISDGPEDLCFVGWAKKNPTLGLIMSSGAELKSTWFVPSSLPEVSETSVQFESFPSPEVSKLEGRTEKVVFEVEEIVATLDEKTVGGEEVFSLKDDGWIQSPYIYCQAAGSTGYDGSARGIHLRWELRGELGDNHLPKGDLTDQYPSSVKYSKSDDFVRIFRTKYNHPDPIEIDFNSTPPTEIVESGTIRQWQYKGLSATGQDDSTILLSFSNASAYDSLKANIAPGTSPGPFLLEYEDVIELEIEGELFYRFFIHGSPTEPSSSEFHLETISALNPLEPGTNYISCRKDTGGEPSIRQDCSDIRKIRFRKKYVRLEQLEIWTYQAALHYFNNQGLWEFVGKFSLSLNDPEVFKRLEDTSKFTVHKSWGKYNGAESNTGAFTVNVDNYKDRWSTVQEGLKLGVTKYLEYSGTDPLATSVESENDPDPGSEMNMEFSYLRMLQVASLDYHVARMLGLGFIDGMEEDYSPFMYLAVYTTDVGLQDGDPDEVSRTHYYLTSPVGQSESRYALVPRLKPPNYGLFSENGTPTPTRLSDERGYVLYDNAPHGYARYINLHRSPYPHELGVPPFFETDDLFCVCDHSIPVLYGVEYRKDGESDWRKPEISNTSSLDPDDTNYYKDLSGLPEVVPLPETGKEKVYTHIETEEGIHQYALYSLNWFNRTAGISNVIQTDTTEFPKRITLIPPFNPRAHVIQDEIPLLFTTQAEQDKLSGLVPGAKTLVRFTFDWNEVHNKAFQYGEEVEFLFRQEEPLVLQGKVFSVAELSGGRSKVHTTSFSIASTDTPTSVEPYIADQDMADRFVGSLLVSTPSGDAFFVENVELDNDHYPIFEVKNLEKRQALDPGNTGDYFVSRNAIPPEVDTQFIIYENLSNEGSWDHKLNQRVTLHPVSTDQEGIKDTAEIIELEDKYGADHPAVTLDDNSAPFPGDPIPGSRTGVFTVKFDNQSLPNPADPGNVEVSFYKGTLLVMEDTSPYTDADTGVTRHPQMKVLDVLSISQSADNKIILRVYDSTFDPDAPDVSPNPSEDYIPIQTGSGIEVIFYPSYKIYLLQEGLFNQANLWASQGEGIRKTFMAARSRAKMQDGAYGYSFMTPPVVLFTQEIVHPQPPGEPKGPVFATRPDFYGKSTYTFDVDINTSGGRRPYALIFYRASGKKILNNLYKEETIGEIFSDLHQLYGEDDDWFTSRWHGLMRMETEIVAPPGNVELFQEYNGYRFPLPDNANYIIPNPDPSIVDKPFDGTVNSLSQSFTIRLYKAGSSYAEETVSLKEVAMRAIQEAFLPLTEQPVIYKYIRPDSVAPGRVTSPVEPKIRDANGNLIVPVNPDNIQETEWERFNPYPMAVKFVENNGHKVRFTDYTLDGASDSRPGVSSSTFYFYFATELSSRMQTAEGPISKPVQLVNSDPAEKPAIKKVITRLADPVNGQPASIYFEVNPYLESEGIKKFWILRTTDVNRAKSVRNMELAAEVDFGEELVDDFSNPDLEFPPYGLPIYYRIVALREITNEEGNQEFVPSKPSDLALATVVDSVNPPAPELWETYTEVNANGNDSPLTFKDVRIHWSKTVHNGFYYIYKMGSTGNWIKIGKLENNDAELEFSLATDCQPSDVDEYWTYWQGGELIKQDEDGNPIYHHFKVIAENASGLLSLDEKMLTI